MALVIVNCALVIFLSSVLASKGEEVGSTNTSVDTAVTAATSTSELSHSTAVSIKSTPTISDEKDGSSSKDPIDVPPTLILSSDKDTSHSSTSTLGPKIILGCVFASFIIAAAAMAYCILNVIGLTCYGFVKCVSMRYKPKPTVDLSREDDLERSLNGDIKLEVLASYDTGDSLA